MEEERVPLITLTGELYQPIRVHYDVSDHEAIVTSFSNLRCMRLNIEKDGWEWMYNHEASRLRLKIPSSSIPEEIRPVILGSFFFKGKDKMLLDLYSFDRAIEAIVFFDRYLSRSAAKVQDVAIVNQIFENSMGYHSSLDSFFEQGKAKKKNDPEELIRRLSIVISQTNNKAEKTRLFSSYMDAVAQTPIPAVELLPSHFYQDGISSLKSRLVTRQIIAFKHWQGNTGYTFFDLMNEILPVDE